MSGITPGNRLYLYQLLSRELGVGKQTLLPRAEEVLEADGLCPEDLGCESMRALCEQLGEFIKLTVFKKGYVYATILANAEYDRALEAQAKGAEKNAAAAGKPWKKRKGKALKPVKPRHVEKVVEEVKVVAAEVVAATPEPEVATEPEAVPEPEVESAPETAPELKVESAPKPETTEPAVPEPETTPEPAAEPASTPEPDAASSHEPAPAPEPDTSGISLTITYIPDQAAGPVSDPKPASTPAAPARDDLPRDFHRDVRCPNEQLSRLYEVLPPDVDPLATLEEDFRVARSTGAVTGTRSNATFPLRYLQANGCAPVTVTLRRSAKPVAGKHWTLADIDLGETEGIGLGGLNEAAHGAWSAFSTPAGARDPERTFTQCVALGSWDKTLDALALLAAPEAWGPQRGYLRDYLTMTFARLHTHEGLAVSEGGRTADFDTGLLTADNTPIYAHLSSTPGDIPWTLTGFSTSGSAAPAQYVTSLAQMTFRTELAAPKLSALAALARNPRLATAAYDPLADEVRLLVPEDGRALALAPTEQGYEPVATLELEDAYVCARVISADQPAWLAAAARE